MRDATLDLYDDLLEHKEMLDDPQREEPCIQDNDCTDAIRTRFPFETVAITDGACYGSEHVGASLHGELDSSEILERTDGSRMRNAPFQSDSALTEKVGIGAQQDVGPSRLEATPVVDTATHGATSNAIPPTSGLLAAVVLRRAGFAPDNLLRLSCCDGVDILAC